MKKNSFFFAFVGRECERYLRLRLSNYFFVMMRSLVMICVPLYLFYNYPFATLWYLFLNNNCYPITTSLFSLTSLSVYSQKHYYFNTYNNILIDRVQ